MEPKQPGSTAPQISTDFMSDAILWAVGDGDSFTFFLFIIIFKENLKFHLSLFVNMFFLMFIITTVNPEIRIETNNYLEDHVS